MDVSSHLPAKTMQFCPRCGSRNIEHFEQNKAIRCTDCSYVLFTNNGCAVAVCIYNAEGQILLIRRAKSPAKATLSIPGGFVDYGERAEDAARREVYEECTARIDSLQFLFTLPNWYTYKEVVYPTVDLFFSAHLVEIPPFTANEEVSELVWQNPGDIVLEQIGLESIRNALALVKEAAN